MKKREYIRRYGKVAWEKHLEASKQWRLANPERQRELQKQWEKANPEKVKVNSHEANRKGGKHYGKNLIKSRIGLRGKRGGIRRKHRKTYFPYKNVIDPKSLTQIHHQWIPGTADHIGVALVEKGQHMHGVIDVIEILEGEITLLTEAEIQNRGVLV